MPKQLKRRSIVDLAVPSLDEAAAALNEDYMVTEILRQARIDVRTSLNVSPSDGAVAFMEEMRQSSGPAVLSQIESGELITLDDLVHRIGGNRQWVNYAVHTGRIFSLRAPTGADYFPSFFAVSLPHRRKLAIVAKLLRRLPAASQQYFFLTKRISLGVTPLEAVMQGRMNEVVRAATSFAMS